MSRALWLRHWDGAYYKPIQGPVVITKPIDDPLPRKINFSPKDYSRVDRLLPQPNDVPYQNPDGTPVPGPSPLAAAPGFNQLQEVGNQVFEMAEYSPPNAKIGLTAKIKNWEVVAVPIRANQKACLPCHVYRPMPAKNIPGKLELAVGDALGVAFYAYRTLPNPRPVTTPAPNAKTQLKKGS